MSLSLAERYRMPMDFYPLRHREKLNWLERNIESLYGRLQSLPIRLNRDSQSFVQSVFVKEQAVSALSDFELQDRLGELRFSAHKSGMNDDYLQNCFAVVRELSWRTLEKKHYRAQVKGAWAMMQGMIAEMETGQGKSLTATLAASAAALVGVPTHVITVNEYLAERDAEEFSPLYNALGLSVGFVKESMEEDEKREQYRCDITYVTNKQIAFDHLRDRMIMREKSSQLSLQLEKLHKPQARTDKLLLRGLCFAVVDEADSVLIDEAVTPLVISATQNNEQKMRFYQKAMLLARELILNDDFKLQHRERSIKLSYQGKEKLKQICEPLGGVWLGTVFRTELVENALKAIYFFEKDKHYLINDEGEIKLIDEFTGRVMADRSWEGGLQQMVEVKEGCKMSPDRETIARISYQRFFARYKNLCGMTGTAKEVERELWDVYRLKVMRIAPEQKLKRKLKADVVCFDQQRKWQCVVERIDALNLRQCPILIGTRSLEASEIISQMLKEKGLEHALLNARQDKQEAEIISRAGELKAITVATNMAGRGTDIKVSEEAKILGGLHVIGTERHESRRIDRQLFGRCGRQGDPGQAENYVSLEDEIVRYHGSKLIKLFLRLAYTLSGKISSTLARGVFVSAQNAIERKQRRARVELQSMDEHFENALSFGGKIE